MGHSETKEIDVKTFERKFTETRRSRETQCYAEYLRVKFNIRRFQSPAGGEGRRN